jgi:hypothetical protein
VSLFDEMLPAKRPSAFEKLQRATPADSPAHGALYVDANGPVHPADVAPAATAGRAFLLAKCGPDAEIREVVPGTNAYEYSDPMPMALRFTTKKNKKRDTRTGRVFFTGLTGERRQLQDGETP